MSVEDNKKLVSEFFKDANATKGDASKIPAFIAKFFSPEAVLHQTTGDINREQYQQYLQMMASAFPDSEFTLVDVVAEGDEAAYRASWSGTHQGEIQGIPPTGKKITITSVGLWRIADGKLKEVWSITDTLGMMQQLGVIPSR